MILYTPWNDDIGHLPLRVDILSQLSQCLEGKKEVKLTFSKLGLTNLNHCLMMPSRSRPRSLWSRNTCGWSAGVSLRKEVTRQPYFFLTGKYPDRPRKRSTSSTELDSGYGIGLRWWVYLHVQQFKDSGVIKRKDALKNKDMGRVDGRCAVQTGMLLKGIHGNLGPLSTIQDSKSEHSPWNCTWGRILTRLWGHEVALLGHRSPRPRVRWWRWASMQRRAVDRRTAWNLHRASQSRTRCGRPPLTARGWGSCRRNPTEKPAWASSIHITHTFLVSPAWDLQ